jgi:hypothetical protein
VVFKAPVLSYLLELPAKAWTLMIHNLRLMRATGLPYCYFNVQNSKSSEPALAAAPADGFHSMRCSGELFRTKGWWFGDRGTPGKKFIGSQCSYPRTVAFMNKYFFIYFVSGLIFTALKVVFGNFAHFYSFFVRKFVDILFPPCWNSLTNCCSFLILLFF